MHGQVLKAPVPVSSRLAVVRTSASCTSERTTGRCNNAPFWVYHGRLPSGATSAAVYAGHVSPHQSQYLQGFCGFGAHKRQAARANARPGDAITRRFRFTTAGWPVGQLAASGGRVHGAGSNASVPVSSRLAVVRTSASCTSERATGRCNNAPFLGCTTAGCPVGQQALLYAGHVSPHQSPYLQGFCGLVRTSAKPHERARDRAMQ